MNGKQMNRLRIVAASLLAGVCLAGTDALSFTLQEKQVQTRIVGTQQAVKVTRSDYNAPVNQLKQLLDQKGFLTTATPVAGGSACRVELSAGVLVMAVGQGKPGPSSCRFTLFSRAAMQPGFIFKGINESGPQKHGSGMLELKRTLGGPAPTMNSVTMFYEGSEGTTIDVFQDAWVENRIGSLTIEGPAGSCWKAAFGAPCP